MSKNKNKTDRNKYRRKYDLTENEISSYTGISIELLRKARSRGVLKMKSKTSPVFGIDIYGFVWTCDPKKYKGVRYIGIPEAYYRMIYKVKDKD